MTEHLSAEDVAAGWIAWSGGPNPVPGQRPSVRFADGQEDSDVPSEFWSADGTDWWRHQSDAPSQHIIAYRLADTPQRQEGEWTAHDPRYAGGVMPCKPDQWVEVANIKKDHRRIDVASEVFWGAGSDCEHPVWFWRPIEAPAPSAATPSPASQDTPAGTRFYIDCEFDGHDGPLLSMALVREGGRSIHIRADVEPMDIWVRQNVLPIMDSHDASESATVYHDRVGDVIKGFIGDCQRPTIIADSPVDIGRFCRALSTGSDGGWASADYPLMTFEVHNVDCYPTDLPGAVQHNAWWDAMALRHRLAALTPAQPTPEPAAVDGLEVVAKHARSLRTQRERGSAFPAQWGQDIIDANNAIADAIDELVNRALAAEADAARSARQGEGET